MSNTDGVTSNVLRNQVGILFLCALSLSGISCGHTQAAAPVPINTAMQAVHEYGREHQVLPPAPPKPTGAQAAPPAELYDTDETYKAHIAAIFAQGNFAPLEKEAHEDRAGKARLRGGVWKLLVFYEGVSSPAGGTHASDSDWDDHIAAVKKWIIAYPDSATAHVALAETYLNYAWAARGEGYADSVSGSGWELFGKRVVLAESTLVDAAKLKEKCPYWYEAMQQVALAQGWEKERARELLDQASAFEPTYYHFYREYANFLLPKWYGEEGETQAFAEEVSARLGDPDGSMIYFEIASLLACQCDSDRDTMKGISWPRVKQGYADLQRLYGTSDLKMNRFAYMSYAAGDKSSAHDTFDMLGDSWNHLVWRSAENFNSAKEWASAP